MHGRLARPSSPSSPPCLRFHHARKHFRTPTTPDPTSAKVRQTHRFPEHRREKSAIFGLPPDRRHPRLSNAPAQGVQHSRLLPFSCGLKELPTAPSFHSLHFSGTVISPISSTALQVVRTSARPDGINDSDLDDAS